MRNQDKPTSPPATTSVEQFLAQVERAPVPASGRRGRLIFAMDATASRQPTWDRACQLQGDMFTHTRGLGGLDIQLCFYRGYREFRASPWHDNAAALRRAGQAVRCLGGHTQIIRLLRHALAEHQRQPVQALVFIGDAIEEPIDQLCQLAGQLGILGVPLFLFQEGHDPLASNGFAQLARLSSGAHCHFDHHSAATLSELLNAVAVYASGGKQALDALLSHASPALIGLTRQLQGPKG